MIEREKTYLLKEVPAGLSACKKRVVLSLYIPADDPHPKLRIRKNGDSFEMTKKAPVDDNPSICEEQTIKLSEQEFKILNALPGKRMDKIRVYYPYEGKLLEIDVYTGALAGLVTVDAEFDDDKTLAQFKMPLFCLADVTCAEWMAGGMLAGKSYADLEPMLKTYKYHKLLLDV